jgi:hypothetical protein
MSVSLFLESGGNDDQGSALDIGTAAVGAATYTYSCFCFLGFCSCWFPARKLRAYYNLIHANEKANISEFLTIITS